MKKLILISMVCLCVFCFAGMVVTACAEQDCETSQSRSERWKNENGESRFTKMSESFGLSEEQKEAMKTHFTETRGKMKDLKDELKQERKALREELKKYESDRGKIDKITAKMKELEAKQIDSRVENFLEMKSILTQEQFKKFNEHIGKRKQHRKWRGKDREPSQE